MRYDGAVELEHAFGWTCPICEARNLADYVYQEPGEEDLKLQKEHNDSIDDDDEGGVGLIQPGDDYRMPFTVECPKCQTVLAVSNYFTD